MGDLANSTKQIIDALKPLADKLGTTAEQTYQLAVKDAVISGHLMMVGVWTAVLFGVFCWFLSFWGIAAKSDDGPIWGFLIGALSFVVAVMVYCSAQHYLLNPEYMAIQELIKGVKP